MEEWVFLLVFSIQAAILLCAFGLAWQSAREEGSKAASRADVDPAQCYRQTGGARFDLFNATIPFAVIVATPARITLSSFGRTHEFDRSEVRSLSRYRGWISTGLRIQHSKSSGPSFVVFWTTSFPALASALQRLGWAVAL